MKRLLNIVLAAATTLCLSFPSSAADQGRIGARPVGIDKTNAQFGPNNRWAFSHMRELYPTALIENNLFEAIKIKFSLPQ